MRAAKGEGRIFGDIEVEISLAREFKYAGFDSRRTRDIALVRRTVNAFVALWTSFMSRSHISAADDESIRALMSHSR